LNLGSPRGALIAGVDDSGPAKPAGLDTGDVIVRFDGHDVKESRDLPRLVASTPVASPVRQA
jgi:serine protease Do